MADSKDRHRRLIAAVLPLLICAAGWFVSSHANSAQTIILALTLALAGYYASLTVFLTLPALFLDNRARAAGIAWVAVIGSTAAVIAPWAIGALRAATGNFRTGLQMTSVASAAGACILASIWIASRRDQRLGST